MNENTTIQFTSIPGHPTYTADFMARRFAAVLQANNDAVNADALGLYNAALLAWLGNASHNRDLGLPLPLKPTQPMGMLFTFNFSPPASTATLTVVSSQVSLGSPCPDLPPVSTDEGFVLGAAQGSGWYAVGAGDTVLIGATVTAPDGHVYIKYQFFNGRQAYWRKS